MALKGYSSNLVLYFHKVGGERQREFALQCSSLKNIKHLLTLFNIIFSQDGSEFLQKYYSNGMTFLTVFPDGSAQVLYPLTI